MICIKGSLANCKKCKLYKNPSVILETNVNHINEVEIIFVGENPGKVEVHKGTPFVGSSGTFLRKYIQDILDHHKYIITNIVYCATIVNGYTCNPDMKSIENCSINTNTLIDMVNPTLVVMLGKSSVNGIMHNIKARGDMRDLVSSFYKLGNKHISEAFITYHPSYVMNASKVIKNKYEKDFVKIRNYLVSHSKKEFGRVISKESFLTMFKLMNYYEQMNIKDIEENDAI
jgi:uracil-DNA glycosylase family 4